MNSNVSLKLKGYHYRRLVTYSPLWLTLTVLTWILFSLVPLAVGYFSQQIFDSLTGDAQVGLNLWTLLALLLGAHWANDIVALIWLYCQHFWFQVMDALLRTNLFQHLLQWSSRSPHRHLATAPEAPSGEANANGTIPPGDAISPGDAVSRFRGDIENASEPINEWYRLVGHGLFAAIAIFIMWRINPFVTVVAVLPLSGIVIVIHRLGAQLAAAWAKTRAETGRITSFISESFGAILAIKVAVVEPQILNRFQQLNDERRQASLRFTLIDSVIGSFNSNIVNLGRGLVLVLAAQSIHAGSFTVGDFAIFVIYLEEYLELPRRLGRLLASHRTAAVSSGRLSELLEGATLDRLVERQPVYLRGSLPDHTSKAPPRSAPFKTLTVKGLTFHYPQSNQGITDINLQLERGSLTVITGRVGSGKTTLLRVLLGLLPSQAGEIYWNGKRIEQPDSFFVPPRVAYTPQVPRLFSDSLRENILLGLPNEDGPLMNALNAAILTEDVEQLEHGLDTLVGPRGVRLSGGQVQRAAAARMFIRQPDLLVFDDLSSALDVETERRLWARLSTQTEATCLVVSHRQAVLEQADHLIVLQEGQVEAEGQLADLLATSAEMQRLWASIN